MSAADQPTLTPVPAGAVPAQLHPEPAAARTGPGAPRGLYQKLVDVILAVPSELPADADGPQNHFRYASINAVFAHLRGPLAEQRILIIPEAGAPVDRTYRTSNNNERVATTVPGRFTFIDAETGEKLGPLEWIGGGQDDAEKGASKGATNAFRTFLIAFFQLAVTGTSKDSGNRGGGNPNKPASKPQKDLIERLARDLDFTAKEFMNVLRATRGMEHVDVDGQTAKNACAEHLGNLNGQQASELIDRLQVQKKQAGA